jgi:CubicO group peptidase (beta-lactamase class C family)
MAEVSGTSFSELTATLVFDPAGMIRSARMHRRLLLPAALAADLAKPYSIDSMSRIVASDPPGPQGDGAAGGVIASAMDLARFDIALTQGRLLSPASLRTMWTPGRSPAGAVLPYGLGWFIAAPAGERLIWHTGLWEGAYSALYLKVPDRHLTLILLANSDGLQWESRLDEAAAERSPFAQALLTTFPATER